MLPYWVRNVDEPGSYYSYIKSDSTFFKPIIVGGIIDANFITLVGAHWMLLHRKPAIGLEKFILFQFQRRHNKTHIRISFGKLSYQNWYGSISKYLRDIDENK